MQADIFFAGEDAKAASISIMHRCVYACRLLHKCVCTYVCVCVCWCVIVCERAAAAGAHVCKIGMVSITPHITMFATTLFSKSTSTVAVLISYLHCIPRISEHIPCHRLVPCASLAHSSSPVYIHAQHRVYTHAQTCPTSSPPDVVIYLHTCPTSSL